MYGERKLTVAIPVTLWPRLEELSRATGASVEQVVRELLATALRDIAPPRGRAL